MSSSRCNAPFVAVRPETPLNPTIQLVEELAHVGPAVVLAPAANDRVDLLDQLLRGEWRLSTCTIADLILEVRDRFLTRVRIEPTGTKPGAYLVQRQLQGTTPPLDLVPEKLETMTSMHNSSFLSVQNHTEC